MPRMNYSLKSYEYSNKTYIIFLEVYVNMELKKRIPIPKDAITRTFGEILSLENRGFKEDNTKVNSIIDDGKYERKNWT